MKIEYLMNKNYNPRQPIFNERGAPTNRVRNALENVLSAYVNYAKPHAIATHNNIKNYKINQVLVVGSGAHNNVVNSDLDLLLIAPNLDENSAINMKLFLSVLFFNNKPKNDAIDVFIRKEDIFPDRASTNVTKYYKKIIDKYNLQLK